MRLNITKNSHTRIYHKSIVWKNNFIWKFEFADLVLTEQISKDLLLLMSVAQFYCAIS